MRRIVLIRHGITDWNASGRIQGQTETHLTEEGIRAIEAWRFPSEWRQATWVCSPLQRTRETLKVMGVHNPQIVPDLVEMNWGDWTGRTLAALREELGEDFRRNEDRGIDLQTPGGESPRDVRARLQQWIAGLDTNGPAIIAMTHKGVIRAAISLATGWDMKQDFPVKLKRHGFHFFRLDDSGLMILDELNSDSRKLDLKRANT